MNSIWYLPLILSKCCYIGALYHIRDAGRDASALWCGSVVTPIVFTEIWKLTLYLRNKYRS